MKFRLIAKKTCNWFHEIFLQLSVWKNGKFSLTKEIFRQINCLNINLFSKTVTFTEFLPIRDIENLRLPKIPSIGKKNSSNRWATKYWAAKIKCVHNFYVKLVFSNIGIDFCPRACIKIRYWIVNDRIGLKWDSAETEASATSTEASAEASAESFPQKRVKMGYFSPKKIVMPNRAYFCVIKISVCCSNLLHLGW